MLGETAASIVLCRALEGSVPLKGPSFGTFLMDSRWHHQTVSDSDSKHPACKARAGNTVV